MSSWTFVRCASAIRMAIDGDDVMVDDAGIAAMVEVARSAGTGLSRDGEAAIATLIAQGYVVAQSRDGGRGPYKLTPAGQAVLDERGVGANES